MSGFFQNTLNDIAGLAGLTSGVILRDYTHAAKTFRTNAYENAPKLKFLFHTYFDMNVTVGNQTNLGLLVKEVKLPNYTFNTTQLNQYNRKRIVQTKIKYDPIEIVFHDDNGNLSTKIWEAYYQYYYNDSNLIGNVVGGPGQPTQVGANTTDYNSRNIYNENLANDLNWGFLGGGAAGTATKVPFFKNITVFGFNQHNFTAYTLINPIITSFQHDTYNYSEGGGTMSNRMTIDYETVVYTYGNMDGRTPGNVVKGFGDPSHYDTNPSPIAGQGRGTVLGQGGLVDAAGGAIQSLKNGNIVGAVANAMSAYGSLNQVTSPNNNVDIGNEVLNGLLRATLGNTPTLRNAQWNVPIAQSSPGPAGLAGALTVAAAVVLPAITNQGSQTGSNGTQYANTTPAGSALPPNTNAPQDQITPYAGKQYSGSALGYPLPSPIGLLQDTTFAGTIV